MNNVRPLEHLDRVYCAGPLFNEAERREMIQIADALRKHGFKTFVPHADGMEFADILPFLSNHGMDSAEAGRLLHQAIFALDTYQVVCGCGSLVLNYNGRVPDEGAVAECTMAWMLGKPIVIYKEDVRSLIAGRDNPLVVGQTNFRVVTCLDQLGLVLKERVACEADSTQRSVPCPCQLGRTLALGREFWSRLTALGPLREGSKVARIVHELFATHRPNATVHSGDHEGEGC
jgi:nucleoside 2-deoxyribosyltransferase